MASTTRPRVRSHIRTRFRFNMQRVNTLIEIYGAINGKLPEPLLEYRKDVLRAAVVLLHACLEDVLRESLGRLLRAAKPMGLKGISFREEVEGKPLAAMPLHMLAIHRGQTVDAIVDEAIRAHLNRRTFSGVPQVVDALDTLGVDRTRYKGHVKALGTVIARRHQIVHHADRKESAGDHGKPRSLDETDVKAWVEAVSAIGEAVLTKKA